MAITDPQYVQSIIDAYKSPTAGAVANIYAANPQQFELTASSNPEVRDIFTSLYNSQGADYFGLYGQNASDLYNALNSGTTSVSGVSSPEATVVNAPATVSTQTGTASYPDTMTQIGEGLGTVGSGIASLFGFGGETIQAPKLGEGATMEDVGRSMYNLAADRFNADQNSWWGRNRNAISGLSNTTQALGSLANIYTGFKQLDLMEDSVDIAKEQWSETKSELDRVKKVRDNLNASY